MLSIIALSVLYCYTFSYSHILIYIYYYYSLCMYIIMYSIILYVSLCIVYVCERVGSDDEKVRIVRMLTFCRRYGDYLLHFVFLICLTARMCRKMTKIMHIHHRLT